MIDSLPSTKTLLRTIFIPVFTLLFFAQNAHAQNSVSGFAWLDSNLDGLQNNDEPGLAGVSVFVQDGSGQEKEATTAEDGSWSLTGFDRDRLRVRFVLPTQGPLASYRPSQAGWNSVQLVNLAAENEPVNAGFFDPAGFCAANPQLVAARFSVGDPLATGGSDGNRPGGFSSLLAFPYTAEGGSAQDGYQPPVNLLKNEQTGSVWGLAWDDTNKKLYQSAFLKRHAGLGPLGLGGIYMLDLSLGKSQAEFIDLAAAGVDVGNLPPRDLPSDPALPSADGDAFALVGKVGLGGIDVSSDGQTLYAMNLEGRELVVIDVASKQVADQLPIPDLGCVNGEVRPFAVKVADDGNLFVGAVCSAENGGTAADLSAHILQLDGSDFSSVFTFSLGDIQRGTLTGGFNSGEWRPWTDSWQEAESYATPLLGDIEFDDDGSMILGFIDRTGHIGGLQQPHPTNGDTTTLYNKGAGGDVIRVCRIGDGYLLEGSADSCPHNRQDDRGSEFYFGEQFEPNYETALGGIALAPNTGEVVVAVSAPLNYLTSGVRWLDNATGENRRSFEVSPGNFQYFGGANGIGDIELICRSAPVEIGSRVWRDTNENGRFDSGEPVIPNLTIELFNADNGRSLARVTSNADGHFGFSSGFGPATDAFATGLTLAQATNYQLRTEATQGIISQLDLVDSPADVSPMLDADARILDGKIVIDFQIVAGDSGLNHLDFGFKLRPQGENGGDPLQPDSNVVGNAPPQTAGGEDGLQEFYGIPVDPSSRLFLAVSGLLGGGSLALLVGAVGIVGTWLAIRRNRRKSE